MNNNLCPACKNLTSGNCGNHVVKTPQEYEAIIAKQDGYIDWLIDEIYNEMPYEKYVAILKNNEKGRKLREEIDNLKKW